MLTSSAVLLHNNAPPLIAVITQALLEHFNWELFDQPLNGHDFTPSDYHLLTYLRSWPRSQHFNNNDQ
jgi:hypothetical protein